MGNVNFTWVANTHTHTRQEAEPEASESVYPVHCILWYQLTRRTSLHREANSTASSSVPVETVSSLAQPTFTYYTLGALSGHVVNFLMVYNDSVFTVLILPNLPCGYQAGGEHVGLCACLPPYANVFVHKSSYYRIYKHKEMWCVC